MVFTDINITDISLLKIDVKSAQYVYKFYQEIYLGSCTITCTRAQLEVLNDKISKHLSALEEQDRRNMQKRGVGCK